LWAKLGTKLLFSTTCHPQTDGQTEVVNRTLSTLLRSLIKKNLREWEECLPHIEFAYNRAVHSSTNKCPFEVVYGFKPVAPIDLLPLPLQEQANMDASRRAEYVKKIHEKTREELEKKAHYFAAKANKHRKKMTFEPGDMVWVHLRKERFPEKRKSKLMPRGDGPFKVLVKINDNAYKIELQVDYGVSTTFNVADLSPFFGDEVLESRTTPFQEAEDDADIPPIHTTQPINQDQDTSSNINQGPLTRSRAKKLQQQVTSLLAEFDNNITENFILPKSYTLVIIRFKDVGCEDPQDVEEAYCMDDTCCQDRTTKSEHHHVNSD
jgi:hypothetical protein